MSLTYSRLASILFRLFSLFTYYNPQQCVHDLRISNLRVIIDGNNLRLVQHGRRSRVDWSLCVLFVGASHNGVTWCHSNVFQRRSCLDLSITHQMERIAALLYRGDYGPDGILVHLFRTNNGVTISTNQHYPDHRT